MRCPLSMLQRQTTPPAPTFPHMYSKFTCQLHKSLVDIKSMGMCPQPCSILWSIWWNIRQIDLDHPTDCTYYCHCFRKDTDIHVQALHSCPRPFPFDSDIIRRDCLSFSSKKLLIDIYRWILIALLYFTTYQVSSYECRPGAKAQNYVNFL